MIPAILLHVVSENTSHRYFKKEKEMKRMILSAVVLAACLAVPTVSFAGDRCCQRFPVARKVARGGVVVVEGGANVVRGVVCRVTNGVRRVGCALRPCCR